jgi:pimeloyl-ACP methyl ester carboxylesterase
VLASTACRLGPNGKAAQRQVAARVRAGAPRKALAVGAASLAPRAKVLAGLAGSLLGPLVTRGHDLSDMATTIEAEDAFDLAACPTIQAPTLIVAGADDRFYPTEVLNETASLIPGSRLELVAGRGHITVMWSAAYREGVPAFLGA